MSIAIQTFKLSKSYWGAVRGQDVHALKELNLAINTGQIFGYLGPNGSGKTTTIKMILGLIFPTEGHIEVFGDKNMGSAKVKRDIGYLPEGAYYPDFLRGEEILEYYGRLYGLSGATLRRRIGEVIEQVSMGHARKRLLRSYSKGMRQRIGLAQALISDPKILILDEPTTGLDPIARKEIRDILANLRDAGKTLLISSHELLEVELICDQVGILYEGVLQTQGTLDELLLLREISLDINGFDDAKAARFREKGFEIEDRVNDRAKLRLPAGMTSYDALELCKAESLNLVSVAPRRETLEELFVRVVGLAEASRRQ